MEKHTYPHPIKAVVLDIDGTLLNSQIALSERNADALRAAVAEGVHVVLATGKTRTAARSIMARAGLKTPGIFLQGCAIYDPEGRVTWQQTLDPAVTRRIITYAEDRGFRFMAHHGTRIMVRAEDRELVEGLTKYHEEEAEVVGPLQNLIGHTPLNKMLIIGEGPAITALRYQLSAQVGNTVRLMQAGIPTMLEVLPPGASKGAAMKVLMKQLGIPLENVMAMGDAENDVEMLEQAGLGVAVGNAEAHLKSIADAVVGTNDEDGVAEALARYVLRRAPNAAAVSTPSESHTEASE